MCAQHVGPLKHPEEPTMLSSVLLLVARLSTTLALVALISHAFPAAEQLWGYATTGCAPAADAAEPGSPPDLVSTLTRLRSLLPLVPRPHRLDDGTEPVTCTVSHA
jgi:hypothetical protein